MLARTCEELRAKFGIAHVTIQLERGDAEHPCLLAAEHAIQGVFTIHLMSGSESSTWSNNGQRPAGAAECRSSGRSSKALFLDAGDHPGFERKIGHRQAFEAGRYRPRTRCPWRDLPGAYGDHHTVYLRWQRWVKSGVPPRALSASYLDVAERGELDLSLAMIDSTVVRAHRHAAGARKKRRRPGARSLAWRAEHADPPGQRGRTPRVLEVFSTGGQKGDAPAGEEWLQEGLAYEEVEAVGGDPTGQPMCCEQVLG